VKAAGFEGSDVYVEYEIWLGNDVIFSPRVITIITITIITVTITITIAIITISSINAGICLCSTRTFC
jgi:hypothetical protein